MDGRSQLITGPAIEPVVPADLRLYGHLSADVSDATLTPLITAARQMAEDHQNKAYLTQTRELIFDGFPATPIRIPHPPIISLVSVKITDITGAVTTMTLTDFIVDMSGGVAQISLKYGKYWPVVIPEWSGVAVRYTCGYGATATTVPEIVKTAIILGALFRYDNADAPMTAAFFQLLDFDQIRPV